jgi:hypothetical protein
MRVIKYDSTNKFGNKIPWSYKPYCKCNNNTKFVSNYLLGFHNSKSFCNNCITKEYKINETHSLLIDIEEKTKIRDALVNKFKKYGYC